MKLNKKFKSNGIYLMERHICNGIDEMSYDWVWIVVTEDIRVVNDWTETTALKGPSCNDLVQRTALFKGPALKYWLRTRTN